MIKYQLTAAALKAFSFGSPMRGLYRALGNHLGGKRRSQGAMPDHYIDRVRRVLGLHERLGCIKDGDRVLELGTGWIHWEAMTLRLFFDVNAVLYDVWDNRQLVGLRNYLPQLRSQLDTLPVNDERKQRANELISKVLDMSSFEEIYEFLGLEYVVRADGSLEQFADESFDVVVSAGVLEHVHRSAVPHLIEETFRVLKPEGWAIHSIDTSDHLSHYDLGVSRKKYLSYPEWMWKALYQNRVQYINRIQRGEWLQLFTQNHFAIREEENRTIDLSSLRIEERYANMSREDLASTIVRVALQKG